MGLLAVFGPLGAAPMGRPRSASSVMVAEIGRPRRGGDVAIARALGLFG
jgi:hypothetical protein